MENSGALNPQGDFNKNSLEKNNLENNNVETDVSVTKEKKKQCMVKYYKSEAVKRAKAKYYQKKKEDEEYMKDMRRRALEWYYKHKDSSPHLISEIEIYFPKLKV